MPVVPGNQGPRIALGVMPGARLASPDIAVPQVQMRAPQINAPTLTEPGELRAPRLYTPTADPNAIKAMEVPDTGAQITQAGRALSNVGGMLEKVALDMQVRVNATVVDDALNQAREAARRHTWGTQDGNGGMTGGYRNVKGYDAIKRPSGKALDDEVHEAFQRDVQEIVRTKLTNPNQRAAFEQQANDIAAQLRQGAAIWQAEQFDRYHTGVYKGMVENLTQDFARLDPGDLASQRKAIEDIEAATATLAAHNGASAQELEVGQRAARGAAVASLFDQVMAEGKFDTAQALLNEWGGKIDANAATKMKLALDGQVEIILGEQMAEGVWNSWAAPSYEAGDADRAFNVGVLGNETANQRQTDENGKVWVSSAGAQGIAQVMPGTAREVAAQLGRPELAELATKPTKEGEAANLLLGKTYFNGLVTQFNGDVQKALAAYNGGPAYLVGGMVGRGDRRRRIEGALKWAAREGRDWRDYPEFPKETRDYVTNAVSRIGAGEGRPARPSRSEMLDQVYARTTDPGVRRAAESWLTRRWVAQEADEREGYEQAYADGLRIVRESGGNINAVPPNLKDRIRPDQWTSLQTYAKQTAEGGYTVTKPEAYYVAMNPATLKAMTPAQLEALRPDLSETDYNAVRKAWHDVREVTPDKSPASLDVSALDKIVDTRLQYLGIDTSPKKGDTAAMARLGAIRQFTHQYVLDLQRTSGEKFTDYAKLQDAVNQMFTRNQEVYKTIMGVRVGEGSVNVLTAEIKDIPVEARKRLTTELERHLRRKPTDAELLQSYFRSQFYTGANRGR